MSGIQTQPTRLVDITATALSSLSLFGCCFVGLSYYLHPRLQTFSFRFFLWMAIFDGMIALVSIFGPLGMLNEQESNHLSKICRFQAIVLNFALLASNFWGICFAIHLIRLTKVNAEAYRVNSTKSYLMYLIPTLSISGILTILMCVWKDKNSSLDQNYIYMVGVNTDFWCWIDNSALLDQTKKSQIVFYTLLVCNISLLFMFVFMRVQLGKLNQLVISLENHVKFNNGRSFLRTIAGGYCAYLAAPFVAYAPANFNWLCTDLGWETMDRIPTWFIISGLLLGVLHWIIFISLIPLVRKNWLNTCTCCRCCGCENDEARRRYIRDSDFYFMQLL